MMSMSLRKIASDMSRSQARHVITMMYSVHGGDAVMFSKYPGEMWTDNAMLRRLLEYQGKISNQNPM